MTRRPVPLDQHVLVRGRLLDLFAAPVGDKGTASTLPAETALLLRRTIRFGDKRAAEAMMTGELVHVDGGYHAMGSAAPPETECPMSTAGPPRWRITASRSPAASRPRRSSKPR